MGFLAGNVFGIVVIGCLVVVFGLVVAFVEG